MSLPVLSDVSGSYSISVSGSNNDMNVIISSSSATIAEDGGALGALTLAGDGYVASLGVLVTTASGHVDTMVTLSETLVLDVSIALVNAATADEKADAAQTDATAAGVAAKALTSLLEWRALASAGSASVVGSSIYDLSVNSGVLSQEVHVMEVFTFVDASSAFLGAGGFPTVADANLTKFQLYVDVSLNQVQRIRNFVNADAAISIMSGDATAFRSGGL